MSTDYSNISNFEMLKTLGEGNFGKVKLAKYKPTNEKFAIKIMNKSKIKTKMKNSIFRENEISTKFSHLNIAYVYNIIDDIENYYIIMEYCKGGELYDYIVKNKKLPETEASLFFFQLINGVEYIHSKGVAHRDLKLENLLLSEGKLIKIIDFGLSHEYDGTILLRTKCGSPSYASPEIIRGEPYDGFKIDIWCCGIILYSMVCGFMPFDGDDNDNKILYEKILKCTPEIPGHLSQDVKTLISNILTPYPENRISIKEIKKSNFYLQGKQLCDLSFDGLLSEYYTKKRKISGKGANNRRNRNEFHSINTNHNIDIKNDFKCNNEINYTDTDGNYTKRNSKKILNITGRNNILRKKIEDNLNYTYKFGKISHLKKLLKTNLDEKSKDKGNNTQKPNENNNNFGTIQCKINLKKKNRLEINERLMKLFDPINKNKIINPSISPGKRKMEHFRNIGGFQQTSKTLFEKEKTISVNKNGIYKILNKNNIKNMIKNENNENSEILCNSRNNLFPVKKLIHKTPNRFSKLLLNDIKINTNNINNNADNFNSLNRDKRNRKRAIYLSTEKTKYKYKHLINENDINLSKKIKQNKQKNNNILNTFIYINKKKKDEIKNNILQKENNKINYNGFLKGLKAPFTDRDTSTAFRKIFGKIGNLDPNNNSKRENILPFIHSHKEI